MQRIGPRYACVRTFRRLFCVDAEADASWEVHMLVAAAAVPLINYFVPTTELANQIADALEDGLPLPAPGPTNNPDGWRGYAEILRDLRQDSEISAEVRIRLPPYYSADEKRRDIELSP
jgi:hypothetical protein